MLRSNLAYWDTLYRFALSLDKARQGIFVAPEFGGTDEGYKRLVLTRARQAADLFVPHPQPGDLWVVDEKSPSVDPISLGTLQLFEFSGGRMVPMTSDKLAEKWPKSLQPQPLQSPR